MVKEAAARVWRGSRRAGRDLVDGLFPHHCALCDRLSHRSLALCEECEGLLTFNLRGCQRCALPDTPPGGMRARWMVRVIVSILTMPGDSDEEERAMIERFVVPAVLSNTDRGLSRLAT